MAVTFDYHPFSHRRGHPKIGPAFTMLSTPVLIGAFAVFVSAQSVVPQDEVMLLASDGAHGDNFGFSVSMSNDTAVVGALDHDSLGADSGAAYVFERDSGGVWHETAKLLASDGAAGDNFGESVSIDGDRLIVGASGYGSATNKTYIFERLGGGSGWVEVAGLTGPAAAAGDAFGKTVSISGGLAIVGARAHEAQPGTVGAAYVYERDEATGNWGLAKELLPEAGLYNTFGLSVAVSGDTVAVGAWYDASAGSSNGAVYVYDRNEGGPDAWGLVKKVLPYVFPPTGGQRTGLSLALDGDFLVAGTNKDRAYVFQRDAGGVDNWGGVASLEEVGGLYGHSVAVSGDFALVGQFIATVDGTVGAGQAHLYERNLGGADAWGKVQTLTAPIPGYDARFGASVGIDGARIIIGAYLDGGGRPGSAYVWGLVPANQPPIALAGDDQTVDENDPVMLDGSASHDPDGDPLAYEWTQLAGPGVVFDTELPTPQFLAPEVDPGGVTLTFQLIVNDGLESSEPAITNVTVKNTNKLPEADAGLDQLVDEGTTVTLDGTGSFDPEGDPIAYSWEQLDGLSVALSDPTSATPCFDAPFVGPVAELLTFELTVSDGLDSDSDTVDVVVENVNHPPVAEAGPSQTVDELATVQLDGSGSGDPDGDPVTHAWLQTAGPYVELSDPYDSTPTFPAPAVYSGEIAELAFELTVLDPEGASATDTVSIFVRDTNAPPDCSNAQPDRAFLWPPNHKLVRIDILGVTDPDDQGVTVSITGVTQDEPIDGIGSGDTSPDAVIQGGYVLLRAEREGGGNGRVYRIEFEADDGDTGVCTGYATVFVPHSKKDHHAVDDGQDHDSTGP